MAAISGRGRAGTAMPTTRAARRAAAGTRCSGAAGGRAGPRALPAAARPRHRCRGADVPLAAAEARAQVAAVQRRGGDARRSREQVMRVLPCRDGRIVTCSRDRTIKVGATRVRAHIQAHDRDIDGNVAAVRAPSAARTTRPRSCGRSTAPSSAFRMDVDADDEICHVRCAVAIPDGEHFAVGLSCGEVRLYVDGTLVRTFEGHNGVVYDLVLTPDGQHIIAARLTRSSRCGTSPPRASCAPAPGEYLVTVHAVAAMPDGRASSAAGPTRPSACGSSTAPSRIPSIRTPTT